KQKKRSNRRLIYPNFRPFSLQTCLQVALFVSLTLNLRSTCSFIARLPSGVFKKLLPLLSRPKNLRPISSSSGGISRATPATPLR
ncbi:hypothetical protein LINGRAHAP2_LOCUS29100, partial [Linum grandiflorum]